MLTSGSANMPVMRRYVFSQNILHHSDYKPITVFVSHFLHIALIPSEVWV